MAAGRQRWALSSTCSTANRNLPLFTFDTNGHLHSYSILICFCLIVHFSQTTALTLTSRMFAKVPQETCWTEMWRCVLLLLLPLSLPNVDTDSCKCYWLIVIDVSTVSVIFHLTSEFSLQMRAKPKGDREKDDTRKRQMMETWRKEKNCIDEQ